MAGQGKRGLGLATGVFWVLLLYIIAALVWWLISLEKQNDDIHTLQKQTLSQLDQRSKEYQERSAAIEKENNRNTKKYVAEGITFLLLIIFGAVYIYRLVRRQFRLQQQQQNFMMAITHELKTPITVAKLNLETIQKHQLPEERQKKLIGATLDETVRLDTLINNILISSQLDSNKYTAAKEIIGFSDLVAEVVRHFKFRYPERTVTTRIEPDIDLNGDPLLLKLLTSNLLENANKYSAKEKPVKCILFQEDGLVKLGVTDEGIGISDEEKKRIFSKFYRIGNEDTRKTKGTGLGLFICKKIAQAHQAAITVEDNPGAGSRFIVSFKASPHE